MTRKEITEGLKLLEDNMVYFDELLNDKGKWIDVHELLFEAIEVLEREFCEDAIDRAEAMTEIMMFAGNVKSDEEDVYIKVSDAVQLLRELSPANPQEPKYCDRNICTKNEYNGIGCEKCEVTKSQEPKFIAKSDGTIEQIKNCDDCLFKKEWEKIGKLLSVVLKKQTEQEPCEDCISRQQAIDKMQELEDEDIEAYGCAIPEGFDGKRAIEALKALPSVQPKPKTGHWKKLNVGYGCSECSLATNKSGVDFYRFCPNCGAKMESEVPT